MQHVERNLPLPDVIPNPIYTVSNYISPIYTDDYFHLEHCELTVGEDPSIYEVYLQGYMTPTRQGIFFVRHFFDIVRTRIEDPDISVFGLLDDDEYCIAVPFDAVPPPLDGEVLFPDHPREPIWLRIFTHPAYSVAFKFRFLVMSFSRSLPFEIRHIQPFKQVDEQCLAMTHLLNPLISVEPNPFVQPYSLHYDPQLSVADIALLNAFQF